MRDSLRTPSAARAAWAKLPRIKGQLKTAAKVLVVLVIFGFIFRVLHRNSGQIRDALERGELFLRWRYLGASYLFLFAHLVSRSLLWHLITIRNNAAIDIRKAVVSWFISILGKNIPGKVFLLAGRVYLYRKHGVGAARVTFCFMLEATSALVASALLLMLCLLLLDFPAAGRIKPYQPALAVGVTLILVALHPRYLQRLVSFGLKRLKKEPVTLTVRYTDILSFVALACFNWLLLGAGFFLLANSVVHVDWRYLGYMTGAFSFAAIVGVLSVFAPAGLGVREGVLLAMIHDIMGAGLATIVVLSARLWMTLGEVGGAAVAILADRVFLRTGETHTLPTSKADRSAEARPNAGEKD